MPVGLSLREQAAADMIGRGDEWLLQAKRVSLDWLAPLDEPWQHSAGVAERLRYPVQSGWGGIMTEDQLHGHSPSPQADASMNTRHRRQPGGCHESNSDLLS